MRNSFDSSDSAFAADFHVAGSLPPQEGLRNPALLSPWAVGTVNRVLDDCRRRGWDRKLWLTCLLEGITENFEAVELAGVYCTTEFRQRYLASPQAERQAYFALKESAAATVAGNPALIDDGLLGRCLELPHDAASGELLFNIDRETQRCGAPWCCAAIVQPPAGRGSWLGIAARFPAETRRPCDVDGRLLVYALEEAARIVGDGLACHADPNIVSLPPRVREVLDCLLCGGSTKEIARELQLSRHTVNQYVKTILPFFGVTTRTELMAYWIAKGWRHARGDLAPTLS